MGILFIGQGSKDRDLRSYLALFFPCFSPPSKTSELFLYLYNNFKPQSYHLLLG